MRIRTLAALLLLSMPLPASAQFTRQTSAVDLPGYGIATHDGPETLTLNPANMAFLPSWGVSFVHADADGSGQRFGAGDGFYAATPILFGIAAGLAVDSVRPTTGDSARTLVSLALAWQTQNALALGAALRVAASEDARFDGMTTLDLSAAWRPVDWLALTFLARDVIGPGIGPADPAVPRSFLLGTGFRPFGDRSVSLDLAGAIDENGRIGGRVAAEVQVPYAGRVIAAAEAEGLEQGEPDVRVTAGLALDWGMIGAGGGVTVGDGLEQAQGWYVTGRIEGAHREGIPTGDVVADITLGGTGARGILGVVRRMERALHDDRVRGVLLRPRGSGIGLAYAQEIRMMVRRLRDAGKPVVCHLDDAAGSEWYACAGADRILVDPAGGVRLTGVSTELFHLGDLLRNVGVRADFVRIGRWKSAIEDYMNQEVSGPARAQRMGVLDWSYRRLLHDTSQDRGVTPAQMEAVVDLGPHLPQDVVERGLAHALADERDMDAELREAFGGGYALESREPWEAPERWGHRPRVGVVVVDGTIVDGENLDIPLIGIHASGGRTVSRAIDQLAA
ncbi:MAG: S49 family peptidase, partial [Sandaracinaceae bacterium]